jgi:predicted GTPase
MSARAFPMAIATYIESSAGGLVGRTWTQIVTSGLQQGDIIKKTVI